MYVYTVEKLKWDHKMSNSYTEILIVSTSFDSAIKIAIDDWYQLLNEIDLDNSNDPELKSQYNIKSRDDLMKECGPYCDITIFKYPDFIEWNLKGADIRYTIIKNVLDSEEGTFSEGEDGAEKD